MLSYLKNFVKKNEADIVLVIGVILVALISFGAGRLTSFQADEEPILIQEPLTASIQQSLEPEKAGESGQPEPAEKGKFVGSIKSDKYHWPWSSSAKRIKPENQRETRNGLFFFDYCLMPDAFFLFCTTFNL